MQDLNLFQTIVFWALAAVTLLGALGVVLLRDMVRAALALVASFLGVAGLFLFLNAPFLGIVQVLIYVGAIAILITFAIMLTSDIGRANEGNRFATPALVLSGLLLASIVYVALSTPWPLLSEAPLAPGTREMVDATFVQSPTLLGRLLLVDFVLPFEIAGVLLLAAVIGALALVRSRGGAA